MAVIMLCLPLVPRRARATGPDAGPGAAWQGPARRAAAAIPARARPGRARRAFAPRGPRAPAPPGFGGGARAGGGPRRSGGDRESNPRRPPAAPYCLSTPRQGGRLGSAPESPPGSWSNGKPPARPRPSRAPARRRFGGKAGRPPGASRPTAPRAFRRRRPEPGRQARGGILARSGDALSGAPARRRRGVVGRISIQGRLGCPPSRGRPVRVSVKSAACRTLACNDRAGRGRRALDTYWTRARRPRLALPSRSGAHWPGGVFAWGGAAPEGAAAAG